MPLRNLIMHNFGLKAISLALAALIWVAIQTRLQTGTGFLGNLFHKIETLDFQRPITVLHSATNRQVLKIEPGEVRVKVAGDGATLSKLQPHEVQVFVKLTDAPRLQGSFPIEVILPRGVSLQEVLPSHVSVEPGGAD